MGKCEIVVGGTNVRLITFESENLSQIPDFAAHMPDRHDYGKMMVPHSDPRAIAWIQRNASIHEPYVNRDTSLWNLVGKHNGETALLCLSGPSGRGVNERIAKYRDHPDFKVFTLNNSALLIPDADYFCCYEQLAKEKWVEKLDPNRTTLLTTPAANNFLADLYKGENVYYAYMGDQMEHSDPRWKQIPLLVSALGTAVAAIQAIYLMGFSNIFLMGADYAIAEPVAWERNPMQLAEGIFYWDGTKYSIETAAGGADCYYNGQGMTGAIGIGGELCGMNSMLHKHRNAMECAMSIVDKGGRNVRNCSGMGILDFNVANLEESLEEALGG